MDDFEMTVEQEIENVKEMKPHVIILGAGASYASFPDGDKNGKKLPLMNNLVGLLEMESLLDEYKVSYEGENFESLYSKLHTDGNNEETLGKIQEHVRDYFSSLELPDTPTIYDHLILSLRKKDIIATFNWDPFLYLAYMRNKNFTDNLPNLYFLHGNVAIGLCESHPQVRGWPKWRCRHCGTELEATNLLFPIEKKDYSKDSFISSEWEATRSFIENAFYLTIFGYGAPRTDEEAVNLMKGSWKKNKSVEFNQTEIIDIRTRDDLEQVWDEFLFSHHYDVVDNFYDSWLANHPRRSCEALWSQNLDAKFISQNPIPRNVSFEDLYKWLGPLIDVEKKMSKE